jgi:hypothetical protein
VTKGPEHGFGGAAKRLALVAMFAGVIVALLGFLVPAASASPLLHPETRVAAIGEPGTAFVGPHASVLAVQGRERGPNYDRSATGSSVAAEGGLSPEEQALQTAIDDGRVGANAPLNHLNGAMAEQLGWQEALSDGEIGIQGPGKITAVGPDYITFDPEADTINVWDAKYSSSGRFPSGLSASKLAAWNPQVAAAVANYSGPYATEIQEAFANGQVAGQIFGYSP